MPARRIIPCLDVRDGKVVKGVQFRNHRTVGDIVELADRYCREGADEIVFYDITASPEGRTVDRSWIRRVAAVLDVPFCVAGGIRSVAQAEEALNQGADKISVNSPALENPDLIGALARRFGSQCVVLGVDSLANGGTWKVHQYTGSESRSAQTARNTLDWVREAEDRGAGEVVLNCMSRDGARDGYDVQQVAAVAELVSIPVVASGGAGSLQDFADVFAGSSVSAALAASVFHDRLIAMADLKRFLHDAGVEVRM